MSENNHHNWLDRDAGPLVRPYALTRGRASTGREPLDLLAFLKAARRPAAAVLRQLQPEQRALLRRAREPVSVVELAAHVDLPLGVVRVLLAELIELGLMTRQGVSPDNYVPDDDILEAVIHGLRAL
jgi:hypothetical protein